jgi:aminopeptidase N
MLEEMRAMNMAVNVVEAGQAYKTVGEIASVDIGSRLAGWSRARKVDRVTRQANRLFFESCNDPLLAEYMVSLPLDGLPAVRQSLSARAQFEDALEAALRTAITRDWRQLSPVQIEHAIDVYLCCLGRALL